MAVLSSTIGIGRKIRRRGGYRIGFALPPLSFFTGASGFQRLEYNHDQLPVHHRPFALRCRGLSARSWLMRRQK